MNHQNHTVQTQFSNIIEPENQLNFSQLLSNSQVSSVRPLKTQTDFSNFISIPNHFKNEKLHDENIRLNKEIQELISYIDKLQKQKSTFQRKYQQLQKKIKMERTFYNQQMQKMKIQVKQKQKIINKISKTYRNKQNTIKSEEKIDFQHCQQIMNELGYLQKRIEEIYEKMKFGITKNWKIQQFNEYRSQLRKQEIKRLEKQENFIGKSYIKRINQKINNLNDSLNNSSFSIISNVNTSFLSNDQKSLEKKICQLKKKKNKLSQVPFIQGIDLKQEEQYQSDILRRINQKIKFLSQNICHR